MKSILDPTFKYVPAAKTDVAATFARIRKEQRAQEAETRRVVRPIAQPRQREGVA